MLWLCGMAQFLMIYCLCVGLTKCLCQYVVPQVVSCLNRPAALYVPDCIVHKLFVVSWWRHNRILSLSVQVCPQDYGS